MLHDASSSSATDMSLAQVSGNIKYNIVQNKTAPEQQIEGSHDTSSQ
jgi:hypothetical protein